MSAKKRNSWVHEIFEYLLVVLIMTGMHSSAGINSEEPEAKGKNIYNQTAAQAIPPGDPFRGKALFMGSIPFRNGGSSCIACHNIAGIDAEGGTLGPDLTTAYSKYGDAGLVSILDRLPFQTMNSLYSNRPLTLQEQADLKAFIKQATPGQPAHVFGALSIFAAISLVGLLLLLHLFWRRRVTTGRMPSVKQS